ncbi:MAG: type II secretion system protein [Terrimicrobiaceae bacterium]|nr:type II secretion system protein [Terrimicrobiaceae bacterium]
MHSDFFPNNALKNATFRRGFTLIELLVVVAIVGILAAILVVSVGAAQKQAATAADISNLRQIGTAIQLHAGDNNGFFPNPDLPIPGTRLSAGVGDRWEFHEAVERYLGEAWKRNPWGIYNHLGNPIWYSRFADPFPGFVPSARDGQTRPFAYGFNGYVTNARWAGRTSIIPNPARIVIMAEVNNQRTVSMSRAPETRSNAQTGYRVNRNGKALYLFCDGRVESLEGDNSEAALIAGQRPNIWRWW